MKRILALLLAAILALGLVACGEKDEDADASSETTTTKAADAVVEPEPVAEIDFSVALVTDTGGIDDKSFNQGTYEGILLFAEETGAQVKYAQSNSDADYEPNLSTFAEDDQDLIVAPGFLFESAISEAATNFPEQNFLIIDMVVGGFDNVASAVFAEEQGSFLVGVAAAQTAKEAGQTKVGFIGGMDFDLIQKFEAGFEAGVLAVDPNMEVAVEYVGDFVDAAKAGVIASKMYDEGAYVIFHAAGNAGNGMITEAKGRQAAGEVVWACGVDKDQYDLGIFEGEKSAVLTSMMKRVDTAAHDVAQMTLDGSFPGGEILAFTLSNNGVSLPVENPNLSADALALVADYSAQIISGELEVPTLPSRLAE